jgi:hypothetical protein
MIMKELDIKSPELLELLSKLEPLVDEVFAHPDMLKRHQDLRYDQQNPKTREADGKEPLATAPHWNLLPWNRDQLKDTPHLLDPVGRPYLDLMMKLMKKDTDEDKANNKREDWKGLSTLTSGFPNVEPFTPAKDFWGNKQLDIPIEKLKQLEHISRDVSYKYLGGSSQALCSFYTPGQFIPWHHNGNAPGYNILIHYNKEGKGNFYSYDNGEIITYSDKPGWVCRAGIFYDTNYQAHDEYLTDNGKKKFTTEFLADHETASWHAADATTNRFTLSTICNNKDLWEDLIDEIESA